MVLRVVVVMVEVQAGGEGREVLERMENVIDPRLFEFKVGLSSLLAAEAWGAAPVAEGGWGRGWPMHGPCEMLSGAGLGCRTVDMAGAMQTDRQRSFDSYFA